MPMWTKEQQKLFEEQSIWITAGCDFALSWVDNPAVVNFFRKFIPQVRIFDYC
jgi:hypothetical protein